VPSYFQSLEHLLRSCARPRSHDTSRIAWAKLLTAGGGGVSARVPELRRRHPADCLQTAFRVRNHPWPSHSWQPPVAADFLSASRGRSGKFSHTSANRSNRRRSPPPTAWGELVQAHDDREAVQVSPDELPAIDIHSL
jgi:hypothetical protein